MKIRSLLLIYIPSLVVISTFGIWFFEYVLTGNPDSAFNNLFSSLWWTVQTVTTLGYGDLAPVTLGGQLFGIVVVSAGLVQLALIISLVSDRLVAFRSTKARGLSDVQMQNHILICSDDMGFINRILEENEPFVKQERIVLVCPFEEHPLLSETRFRDLPWVSGESYRYKILQKANADQAFIAYVAFRDDSHSLMTVMQIEQLSQGEVITMAQFQGHGKRQLFEEIGCDHALDPYRLLVPMMVSAFASKGAPWWIRQLIMRGDYSRYDSIVQKGSPTLENHELPDDYVGKTWLTLIEEWKRDKHMLPMGLMEDNSVMINPEADFVLYENLRVLTQVPSNERSQGDSLTEGTEYQGNAEILPQGHILISTDNPYFLQCVLQELKYLNLQDEIVVISEVDPLKESGNRKGISWIQGCSYSKESIKEARASEAKVAFVDHLHDGLTLIAVLELEQSTSGSIFTVASYREEDFDQQLIKAGCDFCISADELTAPLLAQTAAHPGTAVMIERIISGEPPSERIFSRQLNRKWESRSWMETVMTLKKDYSYLPVGLIRSQDRRMLSFPANDVIAEAGDTVLFMASLEDSRDTAVFTASQLPLQASVEKGNLDDEEKDEGRDEAEELFRQGVIKAKNDREAEVAYRLFLEAAIKGNSRAKYNLGIMNFHGRGVPKNLDEAYYWFSQSAQEGNEPSQKALQSVKALRESDEQFRNSEKKLNMVKMDHLSEDQRFWYAKAITRMVMADGRVDLYERIYLHGAIQILQNREHVQQIEEAILFRNELELGSIYGLSDEDQERILKEMIEIAAVDRDFDIEEQELLREIGNAIGTSRKKIQKAIEQGLEKVSQFQKRENA